MKMEIKLTRGLEETEEFGKISRIELPNKSKIYISKKGWNLVTPDGQEINIPYNEINVAIKETMSQGYMKRDSLERVRRFRENSPDKAKKINDRYRAKNKDKINKNKRIKYSLDKEVKLKSKAKDIVNSEINKGNMKRPLYCSKCKDHSLKIEGHHEDYDKPLEVIWLCRKCHKLEHRTR